MPFPGSAPVAAGFLPEPDNGDKSLFDIGSGSAGRSSAMQRPGDISGQTVIFCYLGTKNYFPAESTGSWNSPAMPCKRN